MANPPSDQPTFEQALSQLESIATAIEQGKIGLEDTIAQHEKAVRLIQHCRSVLSNAEAKIQQLQLGEDGKLNARPLEPPPE